MAYPSQALLDKLSGLLGPKGFTSDPIDLSPWLIDWRSRWTGRAAAMLSPANSAEVVEIVRLAGEEGVPLVPQGGNTSMVGGATPDDSGEALILSLRRMNKLRTLDPEANVAVCEAGVVLADFHEAAIAAGRRFPLSLGARGSATIGGLVSTNAGGTQVLRFGTMRGLVLGIEAVMPDGTLFEGLSPLRKDNRGYDLRHLLIGAEGTLGVVTAAALKLVPLPAARAVAWIGLAEPDRALALLRRLEGELDIEGFELVPEPALDLVLAHIAGTRAPLEARWAWNLLVEATGADTIVADLTEALGRSAADLGDAVIAASEAQADALWKLRESIAEAERHEGPGAKHDISVPVEAVPSFLVAASRAVEQAFPGTRVIAFGHLGDGNLHFNVGAPPGAGREWIDGEGQRVSAFVHDAVTRAGGSISAEHGIGQMKVTELARLGGAARLSSLKAIKAALDPFNIMNPGKIIA